MFVDGRDWDRLGIDVDEEVSPVIASAALINLELALNPVTAEI
tara:strand:+ start:10695 stop:10823 length:129 start_codon:yes stop_codon:yes gene_type:complete